MKSTSKSQATIALPAAMLRQVDETSKREHRTRSELVREALRVYFNRDADREILARIARLPMAVPTAAELRGMAKGRAEILAGKYFTLDEFNRSLETPRRGSRAKNRRARTAPRARASARRSQRARA